MAIRLKKAMNEKIFKISDEQAKAIQSDICSKDHGYLNIIFY